MGSREFSFRSISDLCLSGLASGLGAALHSPGLWPLEVVLWDPALVVSRRGGGNGGAISADNADLLGWIDFLGSLGRALCALATLTASLLLGEQGGDPSLVNEIAGTSKSASEDKVEEDTVRSD